MSEGWKGLMPRISLDPAISGLGERFGVSALQVLGYSELDRVREQLKNAATSQVEQQMRELRSMGSIATSQEELVRALGLADLTALNRHFDDHAASWRSTMAKLREHALPYTEQLRKQLTEQMGIGSLGYDANTILANSLASMEALRASIGDLSLATIDFRGTALTDYLPRLQEQLTRWGNPPSEDAPVQVYAEAVRTGEEVGIGLGRKTLEWLAVLGFLAAILVPLYQEWSAAKRDAEVDAKLAVMTAMLIDAGEKVEKLSKADARRQEARLVAGRGAQVKSRPESAAGAKGRINAGEAVRFLAEEGKWFFVRYYDRAAEEYRSGWVLKKHFEWRWSADEESNGRSQ
ncbi:hypothetical protein [Cupriavidus numazuensis]|uniref:SH3b domain-containing protein n=1 Tax=Cupriavidus numazuensis TaxID=221992 RepID=A0ABM8TBT1_9BURK|nr:hypothetical protein [Cupriavidus numazuensis]CAG2132271.1 hypothetical protein LMG26411_00586 [Cupriavidus numazuensis]